MNEFITANGRRPSASSLRSPVTHSSHRGVIFPQGAKDKGPNFSVGYIRLLISFGTQKTGGSKSFLRNGERNVILPRASKCLTSSRRRVYKIVYMYIYMCIVEDQILSGLRKLSFFLSFSGSKSWRFEGRTGGYIFEEVYGHGGETTIDDKRVEFDMDQSGEERRADRFDRGCGTRPRRIIVVRDGHPSPSASAESLRPSILSFKVLDGVHCTLCRWGFHDDRH